MTDVIFDDPDPRKVNITPPRRSDLVPAAVFVAVCLFVWLVFGSGPSAY